MSSVTVLPLRDAQNTFVSALRTSAKPTLFSAHEKKILGGLCIFAFCLPLIVSVVALKSRSRTIALHVDPTQVAALPGSIVQASDDLAMAEIFLNKANESLSDPAKSEAFISSAQSLLSLTTQTGPKVEELKNRLSRFQGGAVAGATTLQRIAAPSVSKESSISGQSGSNAVSQSVTMKEGTDHLFVPFAGLKEDSSIYVTIPENRDNATVYVAGRETGVGFTLAVTSRLRQDTLIVWYEIESE